MAQPTETGPAGRRPPGAGMTGQPDLGPDRRRLARRPPWPSTPRPRPSRPRARTSSASAPASPTSRRPSTSWRRPWRPAATRKTTSTRPTAGLPELREALAAKTRRDSGFEVAASQVLVTNGGKQAVANSFAVLCDPGDEVLVLAPYWTTYPEVIALAGGVPVVDRHRRAPAASGSPSTSSRRPAPPRTKVLLFVSPSNPTGAVYPREEIEAIGRWAVEHGLWVVTDEIYEHLVYGGAEHHSMPVVVPELADRCIVVNGVAKTYAMTGWRVGWMIGPADVIAAATNLQSHETSNVANVSQRAALAAVSGDLEAVAMMRDGLRPPAPDHPPHAQRDRRGRAACCPRGRSTPSPRWRACYGRDIRGRRGRLERRAGRAGHRGGQGGGGARARPSAPRATSGCPTPWATTTWSKGCPAWPSCSATPR